MRRFWTIFVIGIIVALLPRLGFPRDLDNLIFLLAGAILSIIALSFIHKEYSFDHLVAHNGVNDGEENKEAEPVENVPTPYQSEIEENEPETSEEAEELVSEVKVAKKRTKRKSKEDKVEAIEDAGS